MNADAHLAWHPPQVAVPTVKTRGLSRLPSRTKPLLCTASIMTMVSAPRHACQQGAFGQLPNEIANWTCLCLRRHRHLMLDLGQLLPTAKRDAKLDTKSDRAVINEAAELKVALFTKNCSLVIMSRCSAERAYWLLWCQPSRCISCGIY